MHRLVLLGKRANNAHVIVHEGRDRSAQHAIHTLSLSINELIELGRKLDLGLNLVLSSTRNLAHFVGHTLQVKVNIDDGLKQTEVRSHGALGSNQVVANGLKIGAACINLKGLLLGLVGQLFVVGQESLNSVVQRQVYCLVDREHLVTSLDELARKKFAHGFLQSDRCEHVQPAGNGHRTRINQSDR